MELIWLIAGPLIAALIAPIVVRMTGGKGAGLLLSILPFAISGWVLARGVAGAEVLEFSFSWLPALGVDFALRMGGVEALFVWLVSFIGGLICIYGGAYLDGDRNLPRFYVLLMLFMSSMLGVIVGDDFVLTFVFWELTGITSFLLIGYKHEDLKARKAALQAILVTGGGGLALLVGLLITGRITGESRISELVAHAGTMGEHALFPAAFLLILAGVFTKSAQVPFHFWLPGAMAAPTPVSAYLHSATMVKAGVILLAKLWPSMSQTDLWQGIVAPVGAATMVTGAVMGMLQTDLKRLLAYSTVGILGMLVMLLGLGDAFALKTALLLALVHGLYKGALFMVAGTVDHSTGTRDVRYLRGLGKAMPLLALAAGAAALSMCGVPPTLGFISKELLYEANVSGGSARMMYVVAAVAASALMVGVALIVGVRPFLSVVGKRTEVGHGPGLGLVLPPAVLAGLGLVLGVVPGVIDGVLVSPGVVSLGADPALAKVVLWHGFTPVLALSGATLLLGWGIYHQSSRFVMLGERLGRLPGMTPTRAYEATLAGVLRAAAFLTGWIQNGRLSIYMRVTLGAAAVLVLYAMALSTGKFETETRIPAGIFDTTVVILMCASAVAAVFAHSRLAAILSLGGVGYSVALMFVAFGAPDLAITQLLVETLTVVLFSFVILKLPQIHLIAKQKARGIDAVVAVVAGLAMTLVVWKTMHVQVHEPISPGLVERSANEAFGRNVVNVILVDFRALDTMGEIAVLALACLGVTALLARKRRSHRRDAEGHLSEREAARRKENRRAM